MTSEKTEKPTERKLRDARKNGQYAKSRLLAAAVITCLPLSIIFHGTEFSAVTHFASELFVNPTYDLRSALMSAVLLLAHLSLPVLLMAWLMALIVSLAQAGIEWNVSHATPNFSRLDPSAGLKRLFSTGPLKEIGKGLVVVGSVYIIGAPYFRELIASSPRLIETPGNVGIFAALGALQPVLFKAAFAIVLFGGIDYGLARRKHILDLMMSREEVKREHKNSEGDPHHKAKRKQLHQQISAGGPARGVHKATVVVVNPTHIAIALRYVEDECDAPYIVAKGTEEDALKIRKEAQFRDIPIVRDIPFARTLINYDVGEEVPEELYQAAAAVLKVALEENTAPKSLPESQS